jgi:hypothetical protein
MRKRDKKLTIQRAAALLASRGLGLRHNETTPEGAWWDVLDASGRAVAEHIPAASLGVILSNL